jgi:hypothetical protein
MKVRFTRCLLVGLIATAACLNVSAATRICSVYLESYSALQKQLFLGAEVFQAPQLGALPMMITAGLPGAAQMDNGQPVALHVLDCGDGETGLVVEVTPSGTAEAYLQAIIGAEAKLPAPADGVYTLENGTGAKIVGGRLLLAPRVGKTPVSLGKDVEKLPSMPAVPGVIRVSVSPSALKPLMQKLKLAMAAAPATGAANAEQGRRSVESMLDFYGLMLAQIDAMHMGINIQAEGLFIRSRLAPKPGSDLASLVASGKPLSAAQLAFIEKDSLFGYASGGYTLPETLKRQCLDLYAKMVALSPLYGASQTNELVAVMNQSMRVLGSPMAFTGNLPTNSQTFLMQGAMGVPNPVAYLNDQLAMMRSPAFQKLMSQSGMEIPEPTTRTCKGLKVYTWKNMFDEKALAKVLRASLPSNTPPEQVEAATQASMASMRAMLKFFSSGYEYAATPKAIVFGMGSPAMIEQALDRTQAPAGGTAAEAERITKLLSPSAAPHSLGRLSLGGLMRFALSTQPEAASLMKGALAAPAGEGLAFAEWFANGEALSALLIPASEIKSVTALAQGVKMQSMQKKPGVPSPNPAAPAL